MCDCFHLAFPNWHASAAGEGRRLKGPEQDTDDDLVCEEPEVLEGERPRPQGSSPVEEFPSTEKYVKQAEGDFYDSPTKSSKKGKKIGFGSKLFDKRPPGKMNQTEDVQNDQPEMIVKTVKEVCAEGLVVSGGGKDGIFIKEVKPESPASKHLNVKEGDQILSATVYFDNVSYEDALQILEHAQPYKVAFCVKRKPPPRAQEDAETMRPDITIGEEAEREAGGPEMRGRRKTKKQHDRISWPKFPTFSKGRRANFKRSHSTSEAEEQRKLEISPPTSDTESPLKSPLKSPDAKDKKKTHKMKLKMKMAGRRSKSVEETENEEATDNMEVMDSQIILNITEEQVPVINVIESPKILNEDERTDLTKTRNEYTFPTSPATESLHKVELISLDTTLKTTDITVTLGDDRKEKKERSELKVSIPGKDKYDIETESQLKSSTSGMRTSDPLTFDNIMDSPNIISQTEAVGHQVDSDRKPKDKEILEKTPEPVETDMNIPKVDVSLDMPDVGPINKSPKIGSDMEKKERNILETESYGIRTRGPLAEIATSKTHFANTVNRIDFTSPDTFTFEIEKHDMSSVVTDSKKPITPTPVISQPKSHKLDVDTEVTKIESNFKLPKVDFLKCEQGESITIGQRDPAKVPLLKREEIEIPGMEDKRSKVNSKSPKVKQQKIEKIINITNAESHGKAEEFNVEDVKEAVSKFPAFKLPERDITGVLVQREIKIMEMKSEKTGMTPKGSPCKLSSMSTEININVLDTKELRISPVVSKDQAILLPKTEQLQETGITESKTEQSVGHETKTDKPLTRDKISLSPDVKFKLPKREDIEIPGMEATEKSVKLQKTKVTKDTDTQDEAVNQYTGTDIKADRKGYEKKSKKGKVSMPSFGIMAPDIRFPGIAIELPIKATSSRSDSDAVKDMKSEVKLPLAEDHVAIKQSFGEAIIEKHQERESSATEIERKKTKDQKFHRDVSTAAVKEQDGEELMSEVKKDSPHKKKLSKLKMPKIGVKSVKGTTEMPTKEDEQENDITEVVFDSEKRTSGTDSKEYSLETDKNRSKLKMPSIDVSVPKIKIPKTEVKSKQDETELSKPEIHADTKDDICSESTKKPLKERVGKVDMKVEAVEDARDESGFRLIKFGISLPKGKTEESDHLPEVSEKSIIKADGKTEEELSEVPQGEIKETEYKMKKRKISFPKFGFSKSDSKVSDADITAKDADGAEGFEIKTTEAEFKDSTDSPTKFRLPTIKLPKFGVSFTKTTDAGADIQMPDVSTEDSTMHVKLPKTTLSIESTALSDQKPEDDLTLPEGKAEIKGDGITKESKKEIKSSEVISFSKPEFDAILTDRDEGELQAVAFSKSPGVDVSIPQVDTSIPEGSVEIKEKDVNFTISKHEAENKKLTGGTPVPFKLPSVSLPVFGGKPSKDVKDRPNVDKDIKEPDVSLQEADISMKLKDEALSSNVKDYFITTEDQCVNVDIKFEEATLKKQEVTVTLPKFGISLPNVEAQKPDDSVDKESNIDTKESKAESDQAEKINLEGLDEDTSIEDLKIQAKKIEMEVKIPSGSVDVIIPEAKEKESEIKLKKRKISFPKFGFSKPDTKISDADTSLRKEEIFEPDTEVKESELTIPPPELEVQLKTKSTSGSPSKFKLPTISLPKFDISISKTGNESTAKATADAQSEINAASVVASQDKDTGTQETEPSKPTFETLPEDSDTKIKDTDPGSQSSRFIMPKFEFSFPKLKGPEFKKGVLRPDVDKSEGTQKLDVENVEEKADIPEASLEMEVTMKKTKVPSSEHEFPEIHVKRGDPSMTVGELDVNLESNIKNQISETLKDDQATGGSPIKFKLPSFKLPKFGSSSSKVKAEIDVKGDDIHLKAEDVLTSVEVPDAKIDFNVSSQEVKKPLISVHQSELDIEISKSDISLPEGKLGEESHEVPQAKLKGKMDQEVDPGMKTKRPGFSLPKFGFSKPDIKVPETDDCLAQVDTCKPEGDVELKEQSMTITVSKEEAGQKDPSTTKFTLPSITLPRIGGQFTKEEKTMPDLDIAVNGHEVSGPDTQIQISGKSSIVDMKGPHITTEGQSVSVDLKAENVESGGQGAKLKMPKFGVGLPKVKGFDLSTTKTENVAEVQEIDIEQPKILTEGKVHLDSRCIDAQMKTLPELGFSKPDVKSPEVDISIQKTDIPILQGSIDLEGGNVDIKMPKVESDQKGSTIFGSPTKFKLPSISLPKFGVKSQKVTSDITVTGSELQGTTIKTDTDIRLEEQSSDMPEVGSKVLQVKVKRPSFSFPKFGFGSKPDTATPEVDLSVQKIEVSITEANLPVKEQKDEIPGMDDGQKDLTIVSSPTKFKLPEVNLPKIGFKSSKGIVSLPSADKDISIDITAHEPDIKVSGQMEKDTNLQATIREADVHLTEGKVILPQPKIDIQNISIEGKTDIHQADSKGADLKVKKPSFSLPKLGFSKPDIDASQPKVDISTEEGNIPVKDQDAEITFTDEVRKQEDPTSETKFKMPTINFPKFGLKYPKGTGDISAAEVDFKEPEISFPQKGEVQTTDRQTSIDIKGSSVDVDYNVTPGDIDGTGTKFKLPKFGIGMAKAKDMQTEGKEINIEAGLLCEENIQLPVDAIQNQTIEGESDKAEADSKGLKVKLPELGFSKPDLKGPEIDISLPKAGMDTSVKKTDVSAQSPDIKLQEKPDVKEDTFGSPTRFKLPNISFPKFGIKTSKDTVDIPAEQVDIKDSEVSLPDDKLNVSGEVSTVDVKGTTLNVKDVFTELSIKGNYKEKHEGKLNVPKFGIALPSIKGPDSGQLLKKTVKEVEVKIPGDLPKGSIEAKGAELEVEESKFKLPQPKISLQAEVSQTKVEGEMSCSEEKDIEVNKSTDITDMSSKGAGLKIKKPSFGFPKIGFSKSDGKPQDIQISETAADISLPETTTEIDESEREGKPEITSPQFGSPTKFKLPTIKLPKFGVSASKVTTDTPKSDSDIKKINISSVDYEIETPKLDISDIKSKTAEIETPSVNINIKEKELYQEEQEIKFKIPKFGISLPKVKGPEVTVTAEEVKTRTAETEPEVKIAADDTSLPKVDTALEGSSSLEKKEAETEFKEDSVVSGSPSKFKLPAFKMPKFGISAQKTTDSKGKVADVEIPDTTTDLNIEDKTIQVSTDIHREGEIKESTEQLPESAVKKTYSDRGSPSKFKLPTIKMPKISLSRTKSQDENDTTINAPESKTEPENDSQTPGKSPRFTMPAIEDVLRGFEVEFNVPTTVDKEGQMDKPSVKQIQVDGAKVEESAVHKDKGSQEKSKFKFKFPKLGFSQSSDESDKLVDAKIEESEKHLEASADVKEPTTAVTKEQTKTEKGGWFKFSFSSPTKTAKTSEKEEIIQQPEETEKSDEEKNEKKSISAHEEPEKSPLSEAVEETISPTLSLRSSEAFADISSTVTTEQAGISQISPTKVTVKYAEPTAAVGVNDVQSDVVTSTARCELISMEPHQPEKVNITFSSDVSSTSVDTLKQMSGEIHIITSNIQATPDTHKAAILTNLDAHGIHTSPLQVTLGSDSVLTVEETRVQSGKHTMVERHVVKETLHDDKETILVTQRTRVFEGDSAEPISDDTASSIRRLKDTVHTEKMRFFDSGATAEEVTIATSETTLRHMDSSTDENGGN